MKTNHWTEKLRFILLPALLAAALGFVLSHHTTVRPVHAFSAGPPAGYTGAPGEEPEACAECHVPPDAGTGHISIDAPQTYVPGQTYPITVTHNNADPTRLRWGFELTALDTSDLKAGNFQNARRHNAGTKQRRTRKRSTVYRTHRRRNFHRTTEYCQLDFQLDCTAGRCRHSHLLCSGKSGQQRR